MVAEAERLNTPSTRLEALQRIGTTLAQNDRVRATAQTRDALITGLLTPLDVAEVLLSIRKGSGAADFVKGLGIKAPGSARFDTRFIAA